MHIKGKIEEYVREALIKAGGPSSISFEVDHPADFKNGDYSTNVALKAVGPVSHGVKEDKNVNKKQSFVRYQFGSESFKNPIELAEKIKEFISEKIKEFKIEIAGPGFINFYLPKQFFAESIKEINDQGEKFGETKLLAGQKIVIEHTQPNPFKEFHIGHLMNNAVGESVARILKANNADVKTCSYHGDVGLHVAKAVWGLDKKLSKTKTYSELKNKVESGHEHLELMVFVEDDQSLDYVKEVYAYGNKMYEEDDVAREEILKINKEIYDNSNRWVNYLYKSAKKYSLDNFESIYKLLNSSFDKHFFESESGEIGKGIVKENIGKIFEESEGAVVFRGENFEPKTHTRVFLNKDGLPTYEAKEIGLAKMKMGEFGDYDQSITVTANEQDSFFDVVEVAIGEIFPKLNRKLKHLSHGMLRLPTGKMSSRTGDVITAETLIDQVKEKVLEKIQASTSPKATTGQVREFSAEEKENIAEMVAIGAIKYSILRQAIGGDIVFDFEKSISFEGDSGPYLQYTAVRAKSVLEKANLTPSPSPRLGEGGEEVLQNQDSSGEALAEWEPTEVERMLYRFPEIVERAGQEYAPHHLVTYLTELASAFNSFYGNNKIISEEDPTSPYKVALTESVYHVLKNGLHLLGIKVPERM